MVTRRQFVTSFGAAPFLLKIGSAPASPAEITQDAILAQIVAEYRRIIHDAPDLAKKQQNLRAAETNLRLHAAWFVSSGLNERIVNAAQEELRRRPTEYLDRLRASATREQIFTRIREAIPDADPRQFELPEPTGSDIETYARTFAKTGFIQPFATSVSRIERALANGGNRQKLRLASTTATFDICDEWLADIAALEVALIIACASAEIDGGASCMAVAATLATMWMLYQVWCNFL